MPPELALNLINYAMNDPHYANHVEFLGVGLGRWVAGVAVDSCRADHIEIYGPPPHGGWDFWNAMIQLPDNVVLHYHLKIPGFRGRFHNVFVSPAHCVEFETAFQQADLQQH